MDKIFHLFENNVIALGVIILAGFWSGKLAGKLKLPEVSGYLLAGIGLGYSGLIHTAHLEDYHFIEVLGLSIVALIIGGSLKFDQIKKIGRQVLVITIVQVVGAFGVVLLATKMLLPLSWEVCILLGAIASATAPASPVTVIRELQAKGPLTETLLMVVALDDAACLMIFGVASAVVKILSTTGGGLHLFLLSVWEIAGSITLGAALGFLILLMLKNFRNRHELLIIVIGSAFLAGELAELVGLSALMLNMSAGVVLTNFNRRGDLFPIFEDIELPVFVLFFTLAGASLKLEMLAQYFNLTIVYLIARAIGKVGGAFLGAGISDSPPVVKKYLGFAMLSQAGVAIALVFAVQTRFPQYGALINVIILTAVAFNELIGPIGTKFALTSAGEDSQSRKERILHKVRKKS